MKQFNRDRGNIWVKKLKVFGLYFTKDKEELEYVKRSDKKTEKINKIYFCLNQLQYLVEQY